jgi:hypothetical protein
MPLGRSPAQSEGRTAAGGVFSGGGAAVERVTNGGFATTANWTTGTGWAIAGGKATDSQGVFGKLSQVFVGGPVASGRNYTLSFDLDNAFSALVQVVGLGSDGVTAVQTFFNDSQSAAPITPLATGTTSAAIYGLAVRSNDGLTYAVDNFSFIV